MESYRDRERSRERDYKSYQSNSSNQDASSLPAGFQQIPLSSAEESNDPAPFLPGFGFTDASPKHSAASEPVESSSTALAVVSNEKPLHERFRDMERTIFYSNFPLDFTRDLIREVFARHGVVEEVNLMTDMHSGISRGCGSVKMMEPAQAEQAVQVLHGELLGGSKIVSCRRGTVGQPAAEQVTTQAKSSDVTQVEGSISKVLFSDMVVASNLRKARQIGEQVSVVVQLLNVVTPEDLADAASVKEFEKDIREEAEKFGRIRDIIVPLPKKKEDGTPLSPEDAYALGVGKVFIWYADDLGARRAVYFLNGRVFDGTRTVCACFYPVEKLRASQFVAI